jgi:hypothetical protein
MDLQPTQPTASPRKSRKAKVAGTIAAVGLIGALAAGGVAWAGGTLNGGGQQQTYGTSPLALTGPDSPSPAPSTPSDRLGPRKRGWPGMLGMGGALHGEFVVKQSDGTGYQTVATQVGEVTEVSSSSVTVKSADGYSRTYAVTKDTLVNSTRDGIGSVEKGHKVHVFATVSGDKATAVQLGDVSKRQEAREKWGFGKHR